MTLWSDECGDLVGGFVDVSDGVPLERKHLPGFSVIGAAKSEKCLGELNDMISLGRHGYLTGRLLSRVT